MDKKKDGRYSFTAPLLRGEGAGAWHFVEFPHDVEQEFGTRGQVRVKALINGIAVDRALIPTRSGIHVLILGGDIRKAANITDPLRPVEVTLWKDPDPDVLDIPEALSETLEFLPEFNAFWNTLTIGMRRSMCYWVGSAKTEATQAKRVAELLRRFEEDDWHFGGKRLRTRP